MKIIKQISGWYKLRLAKNKLFKIMEDFLKQLEIPITEDERKYVSDYIDELIDLSRTSKEEGIPKEIIGQILVSKLIPELFTKLGIGISSDGDCDICGEKK